MSSLFRIEDRDLLVNLLDGGGSHLSPAAIVDGLTSEQAVAKPNNLAHSIANIVAHLCYWQEWWNHCAVSGFSGVPEHAAEGWPEVAPDSWDVLRGRYLKSIEDAKRIAATSSNLDRAMLPPGFENPVLQRDTVGSGIAHGAVHNAHHLGQIVTMRRMMGLWPPPAGSMTW